MCSPETVAGGPSPGAPSRWVRRNSFSRGVRVIKNSSSEASVCRGVLPKSTAAEPISGCVWWCALALRPRDATDFLPGQDGQIGE